MSAYLKRGKKDVWQIEIFLGLKSNGKKNCYYETYHGSKKGADARDAQLKAELKDGTFMINNGLTFERFSEKWMKEYARQTLAPKTVAEYERLLSIINPKIGHYKLMNIKPLVLVEFYNAIRNRHGRKKLSETSILRYYALINAVFNKAVRWDLIRVNPNEKIDKPKREKHEARYYDVEQTKSLLEALESESIRNKTLIRLAIDTGARRGELTGLEWEDINFKNNSININKVTQAGRGIGVIEKKPKNDSSIRRVFMTDHTAQLLKELKKHQKMLEEQFGSQWKGSKKIFTSEDGNRIHPDRPSHILKEIIRKNNLDDLPFHGLRHTSVSLLISAGVHTQVISKRVGHSSSATTRDIYSHVFETSEREAVGKLDTILN